VDRVQLNLKMPADLVARLKGEAQQLGITLTTLVQQRLAGSYPAASSAAVDGQPAASSGLAGSYLPASPDLADQLAALERRVAQLETMAAPKHRDPPQQAPRTPQQDAAAPLPDRRLTPAEAQGLLTLPELAQVMGLASQSAITNWISREAGKRGGSAVGGVYKNHQLLGKGLLPGGQKPGWLWRKCV
jgi:hypothetical protein